MESFFRRNKKRKQVPVAPPSPDMDYRAVAATDVGSVRESNQDYLVFTRPYDAQKRTSHGCLALVADGMGGHQGGEIASKMAADTISRLYFDGQNGILPSLKAAFEKANKAIYQHAQSKPFLRGMGTTCTALVLLGGQMYLGHVGDSRAYVLKGGKLQQLSTDHTYVQHLLDTGQITEAEMYSHPERNVITRAMGTASKLQADFGFLETSFEEGDRLLMCSDGLYEYIKGKELSNIASRGTINEATQALIHLAKQRGGHDNISVLMVEAREAHTEAEHKQTQKLTLS